MERTTLFCIILTSTLCFPGLPARHCQAAEGNNGATAAQDAGKPKKAFRQKGPETVGSAIKQETVSLEATSIFEQNGILTPRGTLVLEPSLQYTHSSSNRIALVGYTVIPSIHVGFIDVRDVENNTMIGALSLRYGLTSRFELEAKVPYAYRVDSSTTNHIDSQVPNSVFSAEGHGLGDVEFGARYQLNRPTNGGAYLIAGVRGKSNTGKDPFEVPIDSATNLPTELPTGSGFWGIQPSLSAIFPSDPAVFFGSVSYLYNISRTIAGYGKVDPGDILDFNFGIGFAVNDRASLSFGYDHAVVGRVKVNEAYAAGSLLTQVGQLLIGYSYKYSESTAVSVSLGAGLTEAAPDVQVVLRVPTSIP